MLLVVGSLMASSLGWSLALGCKPAAVLRLLWYRLGLFCIVGLPSSGGSLLVCGLLCLQLLLWLYGIEPGYLQVLVGRGVASLRLLVCGSVWYFWGRLCLVCRCFVCGACC